VQGVQALSVEDVVQLAGASGESIWLVDGEQIAVRLGESAYVEAASVSVALPDRLTIQVTERRPEVRWRAQGTNYLVAADGRVLGVDQSTTLTNTLVIDDRSPRQLAPNDRVDADALKLSQLIAVRLPAEVGVSPASIGWDLGTGVFITTGDQRTIVFGEIDQFDQKLAILDMLLQDGTAFTYLDLRPSTPYYRSEGPAGQP
jgi:cell division protein FtsQ